MVRLLPAFLATAAVATSYTNEEIAVLDDYCAKTVGSGSYCKYYKDPPVCHGPGAMDCSKRVLGATATTTTPTKVVSTKVPNTSDPCKFEITVPDGVNRHETAYQKWTNGEQMMRCMEGLQMNREAALFTLHTLKYGVTESYSFTNIVNGAQFSEEENLCNFKVHEMEVDLAAFFDQKISEYSQKLNRMTEYERTAYLAETIPAGEFHFEMNRVLNNLHDAHTHYITPLKPFLWALPFGFDSHMNGDTQVVTLRNIESYADFYTTIYGNPPSQHNHGDVITKVDGIDVLDWMQYMVSDEGIMNGQYQEVNQRINANFFSASIVAVSAQYNNPPKSSQVTLTFEDGATETINWMGRFSDFSLSLGYETDSTRVQNQIINSNRKFKNIQRFEEDFYHKDPTTVWAVAYFAPRSGGHDLASTIADVIETQVPDTLAKIKEELESKLVTTSSSADVDPSQWVMGNGMTWTLRGDTVVVSVPSFEPKASYTGDDKFYYLPDFVKVQEFARANGVTRVLMDMSGNGGGYVVSAYALEWYLLEPEKICSPLEKHMTWNWRNWVESFGRSYESTIDKVYLEQGDLLGEEQFIHDKFIELYRLIQHADSIYPEYYKEEKGYPSMATQLGRLYEIESSILAQPTATDRALAFIHFIKSREMLHPGTTAQRSITPESGWFQFENDEVFVPGRTPKEFDPPLSQYTSARTKKWGKTPSDYSLHSEFGFCRSTVHKDMDEIVRGKNYDRSYWTDISFMTDGTCGSACSMFTQNLQLYGKATAFTFGGMANQPMDVSSFAGGNVEDYDNIWPGMNVAAHLGNWATFGRSDWSKLHKESWVNYPTAFPTPAGARYNWNMMFAVPLGEKALPRQFYFIPAQKHFNLWANSRSGREAVHEEIVHIKNWATVRENPQWPSLGMCPSYTNPDSALVTK